MSLAIEIILVLVSVVLIVAVLMQKSKSAGLGGKPRRIFNSRRSPSSVPGSSLCWRWCSCAWAKKSCMKGGTASVVVPLFIWKGERKICPFIRG